jgi:hypothetical protein
VVWRLATAISNSEGTRKKQMFGNRHTINSYIVEGSMRHILAVLAFVLAWLMPIAASEREPSCAPSQRSYLNVASAIRSLMSDPKGVVLLDSVREKIIQRSGDSAAVAIAKQVSDEQLAEPYKMTRTLYILRSAFEYPDAIENCIDRKPKVTMLLLEHLQQLQNESLILKSERPNR